MKKIVLLLIIVIIFVVVQWSKIKPVTYDGLSGTYLGVGQTFGFDLRIDNDKSEIEWFLDVKNSDLMINSIVDKVKIELFLETGETITLVSTDEEEFMYYTYDHNIINQTVNSTPIGIKITYNTVEEEIKLNVIAIK